MDFLRILLKLNVVVIAMKTGHLSLIVLTKDRFKYKKYFGGQNWMEYFENASLLILEPESSGQFEVNSLRGHQYFRQKILIFF